MTPILQKIFNGLQRINITGIQYVLLFTFCMLFVFPSYSQRGNKKPKIEGQRVLTINEGQSITITLNDLVVRDRDDFFYPWGFSLDVYEGAEYSLSDHTVTPRTGFSGKLKVPVSVNDGEDDSDKFDLEITVTKINNGPTITGQKTISTSEDNPLKLLPDYLNIEDPDDVQFTLTLSDGDNYSVTGDIITPDPNFNGTLSIPVTASDGEFTSSSYPVSLEVTSVNDPPVITGQQAVSFDEDTPLNVSASHLVITDPDNTQFSISISNGENYIATGSTLTPSQNFYGALNVSLTVNDGEFTSESFTITITVNAVNDPPKITGQQVIRSGSSSPIELQLNHVSVEDPDHTYPNGFKLLVLNGNNYNVSGNIITPVRNFSGDLSVGVKVNDGSDDSQPFNLIVSIDDSNNRPIITSQQPVIINEDENFTITFSHLKVTDDDSLYPQGFTMNIGSGNNYSVNGSVITPLKNFTGNIFVPVSVHDGENTSGLYNFQIVIRAVNDAPLVELYNVDSLRIKPGSAPVNIFQNLTITDVDNDSLTLAEVGFPLDGYRSGFDFLTFQNTPQIKAVFDSQGGILALFGKASVSQYVIALKSVQIEIGSQANTPIRNGTSIFLTVSDGQNNSNKVTKVIELTDTNVAFDIPTGFTPNGDAVNDTWGVKAFSQDDFRDAVIRVYTKSGLLVFESSGLQKQWDGQYNGVILPADVYFYTIDLNIPQSDVSENHQPGLKGIVTILR
jgi:gliding motility-associated-like protein